MFVAGSRPVSARAKGAGHWICRSTRNVRESSAVNSARATAFPETRVLVGQASRCRVQEDGQRHVSGAAEPHAVRQRRIQRPVVHELCQRHPVALHVTDLVTVGDVDERERQPARDSGSANHAQCRLDERRADSFAWRIAARRFLQHVIRYSPIHYRPATRSRRTYQVPWASRLRMS